MLFLLTSGLLAPPETGQRKWKHHVRTVSTQVANSGKEMHACLRILVLNAECKMFLHSSASPASVGHGQVGAEMI